MNQVIHHRLAPRAGGLMAVAVALLVAGCTVQSPQSSTTARLSHLVLVGTSTSQDAYAQLIPAFQLTQAGQGVVIDASFGGSGAQAQAVLNGLDADVVALSLESDVNKLVAAGIVAPEWNQDAYHGMLTDSVVVLAVRPGNPKNIRDWPDLLRPGIDVVTPDVFQSGGARWNVLGAYGAQLKRGGSADAARAYLEDLLGHVTVQPASAREAMTTFVGGKGDVLIAYENEAITAQHAGQPVEYVVPSSTILIESPIAVSWNSRNPTAAHAFVDYLRGADGQRRWGRLGFRPILQEVAREFTTSFAVPSGLFTIADLGGWPTVDKQFFDRDNGMISQILQDLGRSGAR